MFHFSKYDSSTNYFNYMACFWVFGGVAATFKQNLKNQEALEGGNVVLRCELSKAGAPVQWWKGEERLMPGGRYRMRQDGKIAEMAITNVLPSDAGMYSCDTGNHKSSAEVKITGTHERFAQIS